MQSHDSPHSSYKSTSSYLYIFPCFIIKFNETYRLWKIVSSCSDDSFSVLPCSVIDRFKVLISWWASLFQLVIKYRNRQRSFVRNHYEFTEGQLGRYLWLKIIKLLLCKLAPFQMCSDFVFLFWWVLCLLCQTYFLDFWSFSCFYPLTLYGATLPMGCISWNLEKVVSGLPGHRQSETVPRCFLILS